MSLATVNSFNTSNRKLRLLVIVCIRRICDASRKTVQVIRVQQQKGTRDCGLFAIVYAVHLANNKDPST